VIHSGTLPPQSMMLTVTRPVEQVLMGVPGIRRVRSRSIRGATEISAQFNPSTDMVVALQQVQNRVAEITGELPPESQIEIERLTPAIFPVFILSMTGPLSTADLFDYATYVVKPELARVQGAGTIQVLSSDSREIEVILDPAKLTAAGLTVVDLSDALKAQNTTLPVGRFAESGQQHLTLASGLWRSHCTSAIQSARWIHGQYCRPDPTGPPAPNRNGGSICGRAPPSRSSTRPVRMATTRVRSLAARAASVSHWTHTPARKSEPGGVSSVAISSPSGP